MESKTIGKNVRAHREARGLTQQELARRAMTCTGTIYLIERGRRSHPNTLRRVARALRVKLRELEAPRDEMVDESRMAIGDRSVSPAA